jgi:hypothetical protein
VSFLCSKRACQDYANNVAVGTKPADIPPSGPGNSFQLSNHQRGLIFGIFANGLSADRPTRFLGRRSALVPDWLQAYLSLLCDPDGIGNLVESAADQ